MTALGTTPQACEIHLVKCLNLKKKSSCSFPLGKTSAPLYNQTLGCRGATALQGEMMPLCWTQQESTYFAELGCPPPQSRQHPSCSSSRRQGRFCTDHPPSGTAGNLGTILFQRLFIGFQDWCQACCSKQLSNRDLVSPFTGLL